MNRRRLLLIGLLAAFLAAGAAVWLFWPRTAITRQNAAKIQVGITVQEVKANLGGPSRDESDGIRADDLPDNLAPDEGAAAIAMWQRCRGLHLPPHVWVSNSVVIQVDVDEAGRVRGKEALPVGGRLQTPLDMVRRWLRL